MIDSGSSLVHEPAFLLKYCAALGGLLIILFGASACSTKMGTFAVNQENHRLFIDRAMPLLDRKVVDLPGQEYTKRGGTWIK